MSLLIPASFLRPAIRGMHWLKHRTFECRLVEATRHQRDWLLRRVVLCRDTQFGKDHGFADLRTIGQIRQRLPVAGYAAFAPYINAVAAGDTAALIPPSDELLQFTITTGSTGTPKLNPVTAQWLKEYQASWDLWGLKLFSDHPRQIGRRVLQMAGTWDMGRTPGGHQISMVSALLARRQSPFLRPYYALPEILNTVADPVARHYTALRLCMAESIGWIILMNPGSLLKLAEIGDQNRELLIQDIADGTLSTKFDIPDHVRTALPRRSIRADLPSARRLAAIVERTGHLLPRDYWDLPVIGCWLGGTAGFPSRYLSEVFGASPLRDMGLVSSEGRHTIPLEDHVPQGVPAIDAGFYEFVPVNEPGTVLEGHELTVDTEYRLLITNSAGYFRFDVGDIVCCRGFVGQAPLLEFLQKQERIGDLEGEKVTEHQIIEAAHQAAGSLGITLGLITAIPRRGAAHQQRYDILVERGDIPDIARARDFLAEFDRQLAELNFLWRARRREGVLGPPRLHRLPEGAWDQYIQGEVRRRGTGDFQYKHPGLVRNEDWVAHFRPLDTISLA
ncbi:MAG: GH3 auxin-responsive promoter [Planctomycetota bacterium]|nr:MAG: GH3 auxin-responsive promoter [Planctomycetota bacterium]